MPTIDKIRNIAIAEMGKQRLSLLAVAKKAEIDPGNLHRFMNGPVRETTSFYLIVKLMKALDIKFARLDEM